MGNFCRLCGKTREDPLIPTTLGEIEPGVFVKANICKHCEVVVHNIGMMYFDAQRELREKRKKMAEETLTELKVLEGKGKR